MIVYNVFDGDECEDYFPTLAEAIAYCKSLNDQMTEHQLKANVRRIDCGNITRAKLCLCLKGEGFALSQTVVYPSGTPEKE